MKQVTTEELKSALEAGAPVTVLDIREKDEHEAWSIPGSRNMPVYEALRASDDEALVSRAAELPRDRRVVAVCRMGIISRRAAEILGGLGFDAASLAGGMRGWGGVWSVARLPLRAQGATGLQVRRNGKGCLSYLLGAGGEAAVVDPSVDARAYLGIAEREGLRIVKVVETHVHADHLSRGRELARLARAALLLPENERVAYPYERLSDGDRFEVGGVSFEVIATPGHTGESVCYLVAGEWLLSGDTLFVDSVGRPDLERGDSGAREAARRLHASLRRLLGALSGETQICPCHHGRPIPFDGRPVASRLEDVRARTTLLSLEEGPFVEKIVASLGRKPPNFAAIIAINEGRADLGATDPLDLEAGPNLCAAG